MRTFTAEDIIEQGPCYSWDRVRELVPRGMSASELGALDIPAHDRLWALVAMLDHDGREMLARTASVLVSGPSARSNREIDGFIENPHYTAWPQDMLWQQAWYACQGLSMFDWRNEYALSTNEVAEGRVDDSEQIIKLQDLINTVIGIHEERDNG